MKNQTIYTVQNHMSDTVKLLKIKNDKLVKVGEIRRCKWCGDKLRQEDDLVCGYHWLKA